MLYSIKVKIGGKILRFELNDFEKKIMFNEVFRSQNYFPKINADQDFKIGKRDTVIDIGANVGLFSIYAATLAKRGKVYAFEPVKDNFKRLGRHKKINRSENLTLVNKGVSNRNKRAMIYLCEKNSGGHSLNKNKFKYLGEITKATEAIDCVTLKSIFDKYKILRCDFLKLDCEGEEANILMRLPNIYFRRIDKISLEFHRPVVDEIKLAGFLAKRGFRVTINNFGSTLGMIFAKRRIERTVH